MTINMMNLEGIYQLRNTSDFLSLDLQHLRMNTLQQMSYKDVLSQQCFIPFTPPQLANEFI